jgi:hypothetical protein
MVAGPPAYSNASPINASEAKWVARAFALMASAVGAWLVWSLFVVGVEFDDGYATIVNSQYFLGISDEYIWSRAPMLAWMLMPAEWAATALGLHPLDVRPHHLLIATVHFGYFWVVWRLLRHRFGASLPVLIAFTAAIPTVVFFGYAAFISSDLFPGLIALTMLLLADRYATQRTPGTWLVLVALGAAAALVKHMYGAIWFAVLVAHAGLTVLGPRRDWILLIQLAAGAAVSAMIFWVAYALVLADSFPDAGLLIRPLQQMRSVVAAFRQEGAISSIIYQWVYLKNLSIYGILAMSLVLPGIAIGWRSGDRLQRSIAIAWIVLFAVMQSVSFKEARYLAYLAPLTAFLIVPVITELLRWRRLYVLPIAAVLAIDLGFAAREGARLASPFYRNQVQEFLAVLPPASELDAPIITTRYLSFVSPDKYAFFGDRYHRIINLNHDQIRLLYGYPADMVRAFPNVRALTSGAFAPGSILLYVNDVAARVPPLRADNRTTLQEYFVQLIAVAETLDLRLDGEYYQWGVTSKEPLMLLRADSVDAEPLAAFDRFPAAEASALRGLAETPEHLQVVAFRIHALCNLSGCQRF